MSRYVSNVKTEIDRWAAQGLIDRATAGQLVADIETRKGNGLSFGSVLAIMAATLVGAAILLFISANWELIPRLTRVLGLFGLILGGYAGGAVLKIRGNPAFGEVLYLVGAAAFGGSIALVGQMYHMSGDETEAVFIWCVGTILAAAGLRSPILTNASVVLAVGWLTMRGVDFNWNNAFPHMFLVLAAVIWAVSYWTKSIVARHLLLLSIILYALMLGVETSLVTVGIGLALVSAGVFLAAHFAADEVERFAQLGGPYPAYSLVGFLVGIGMVQAQSFENFGPMLLATLVAFGGIVAALLMRGRQSALMRWIAYAAFTVELGFLYIVTLGTMIDTAALFLFSGVALALVAFFIMRIEKRFNTKPLEGAKA